MKKASRVLKITCLILCFGALFLIGDSQAQPWQATQDVTRDGTDLIFSNGVKVEFPPEEGFFRVHLPNSKLEVRYYLFRTEYGRLIYNDNRPEVSIPHRTSVNLGKVFVGDLHRLYIINSNSSLPRDYITHFGLAVLHRTDGSVLILDLSRGNDLTSLASTPAGLNSFTYKMVDSFKIPDKNISTNFASVANSMSGISTPAIKKGCCCNGVLGDDRPSLIVAFHGFGSNSKNMRKLYTEARLKTALDLAGMDEECIQTEYIDYDSKKCTKEESARLSKELEKKYGKKVRNGDYCKVKFVGHSHGGNIALNVMYPQYKTHQWRPLHVYTFATPLRGGLYTGNFLAYVLDWTSLGIYAATAPCMMRELSYTFDDYPIAPVGCNVYHYRTAEKFDKVISPASQKNPVPGNVYDREWVDGHRSIVTYHMMDTVDDIIQDMSKCVVRGTIVNPDCEGDCDDQQPVLGTGVCGDGVRQMPNKYGRFEECDGGDLSGCKKGESCDRYCKCSPNPCGNNELDPGEDCDPPGSACATAGGAPGECSVRCLCDPLCGNGKKDPGEECDPKDGKQYDCMCNWGSFHKVKCNNKCKIPGCDHLAEEEPEGN